MKLSFILNLSISLLIFAYTSTSYAYRIGLCVTATYKYVDFIKPFLDSCRKHFLKKHDVTYFVFTDQKIDEEKDVVVIYQEHKPWPYITLERFERYYEARELLSKMDYVFASDVDMKFVDDANEEILGELVATKHPCYFACSRDKFTYERRSISTACINSNEGEYYFAGGFYGGTSKEFIKLAQATSSKINDDLSKKFVALWHDESHLNRYFIDNPPTKILSPSYCYPEFYSLPFKKILLALEKQNKAELQK